MEKGAEGGAREAHLERRPVQDPAGNALQDPQWGGSLKPIKHERKCQIQGTGDQAGCQYEAKASGAAGGVLPGAAGGMLAVGACGMLAGGIWTSGIWDRGGGVHAYT